jgi:hypothetical protein
MPTKRYLAFGLVLLLPCLSANYSFGIQTSPATATTVRQKQRQPPAESQLVEQFSFLIKDFQLNHQSEMNNLNISVRYRYAANISNVEYPDFRSLVKDIETFLNSYPNDNDYWEIVNKQLTSMLMKKNPPNN